MRSEVKNPFSNVDGVSDDYDLRDVFLGWSLTNTVSDSKQLGFWAGNKCCMMKSLNKRLIRNMYVWNGCSNIVLDVSIYCNNGYGLQWRQFNNHRVELMKVKFIIFSSLHKLKENLLEKMSITWKPRESLE